MSADTESSSSGGSSMLLKIGGFILIAGAVFGYRMWNKSGNSAEAADVVKSYVVDMPAYESNKDYLDGLVKTHHEAAFDENYKSGGRRRSAKFDALGYGQQVFGAMIAQAKKDGKEDLAASITKALAEFQRANSEPK